MRPGDEVAYIIESPARAVMVPVSRDDDPFATFTGWSGDEDRQAYGEL